jgi:hypothetical protein
MAALAAAIVFVIVDGVDLAHWAVVAALVLLGLGAWLTMVRPAVLAHDDHVLVRNALSDTAVPWHLVQSVEARQVLVIRTGDKTVHGLAVGRTTRQQLMQRRGAGSTPTSGAAGAAETNRNYADMVALRLDSLASTQREQSTDLAALDKRWRWAEVAVVAGVAVAFVVLVILAVA